jgi:hypothetical protein
MKKIILHLACLLSLLGCSTYSFHTEINPENLNKISIIETHKINKNEISINNNRLILNSINIEEDNDAIQKEYNYSYIGENNEIKSASIIIIKNENKSGGITTSVIWKNVKLTINGKSSTYEIEALITNNGYLTFDIEDTYSFNKYYYVKKNKTEEIVKLAYIISGLTIELNGEIIGYINLLNKKEIYLIKTKKIPNDVYFLTMLTYQAIILDK